MTAGDPCTADLCIQGGGCDHPPAANGVACNGGTCQTGACCAAGDSCVAGLHGDYFDNSQLSGAPAFTRIDPAIDFWYWSPGAPLGAESYSVRWTGQIAPDVTEPFTFHVQADDEAQLWVNCVLVAQASGGGVGEGTIDLVAGARYDIRLEYRQTSGDALVQLKWHSASFDVPWQVIPSRNLYAGALTCSQCDDADPSTEDLCTVSGGCAHLSASGLPCNGGICRAGACLGGCDDGNPCTTDDCVAPGGPAHTPRRRLRRRRDVQRDGSLHAGHAPHPDRQQPVHGGHLQPGQRRGPRARRERHLVHGRRRVQRRRDLRRRRLHAGHPSGRRRRQPVHD